jgi:hypothetical protein
LLVLTVKEVLADLAISAAASHLRLRPVLRQVVLQPLQTLAQAEVVEQALAGAGRLEAMADQVSSALQNTTHSKELAK